MSLVHSFKYRGKIQLARPLGLLLLTAYLQFWRHEAILILRKTTKLGKVYHHTWCVPGLYYSYKVSMLKVVPARPGPIQLNAFIYRNQYYQSGV